MLNDFFKLIFLTVSIYICFQYCWDSPFLQIKWECLQKPYCQGDFNPRDRQYGKYLVGQEKGHLHLHLRGFFFKATKGDK